MTNMVHERHPQTENKSARQTRELLRRLGKLTEAQAAMGWGIVLLIVTLVGAIYLNQSSKVAAIGRHVQELEYELDEVQRQNGAIERDIAEAQSLERLHAATERMGFIPTGPGEIEYLVVPDYPESPLPLVTVARQERPARPVDTLVEALTLVLREHLDDLMRGESGE